MINTYSSYWSKC